MADILKTIKEELPKVITDVAFEGANIVLYTEDKEFFKNGFDYSQIFCSCCVYSLV